MIEPICQPPQGPRRLGLVLSGGGGRGGAHLGVLAVLRALRIPIDVVVGTSVGALGVMYAAGLSLDTLDRFFRATQLRRIASSDPLRAGLIGPRKREALTVELLGERTFADLPIRCAVVTVDLASGREVVLDSGPLVPAMLATTALPGIFPPVLYGNAVLVDGGVVNNMPVDVAERLGAQRVIAVQLAEPLPPFHLKPSRQGVWRHLQSPQHLAVLSRAMAILRAQTSERLACHVPTLILRPELRGLSLLDMAHPDIGRRAGELAAFVNLHKLLELRAWRLGPQPATRDRDDGTAMQKVSTETQPALSV
jgi:NTE family protein